MATLPTQLPAPTEDDKTMAMLSYILSIFSGWLAPLIIWLVKRDSKFVSFHAAQTLFWHLLYLGLTMVAMMVFWAGMFGVMFARTPGGRSAPPPAFFVFFPLIFLVFWGGWIVNAIIGVVFAIKAKNGEWPRLPLVSGWATRAARLYQ
jgi:hypothetical protein